MIKLILLLLVCIKISTGYYEEYSGYNSFPGIDNSGRPYPPIPVNYGDPQVRRRKPCPHRRSNNPEEWVPSFKTMLTKPLNNYALEPQSLKNENVNDVPNVETKTEKPEESTLDNDNIAKSSDTDPNDTADPSNSKSILEGPSRRSNGEELLNNDEPTFDEDYDCDIELDTEVQGSAVTFGPIPKTIVGVEQKVIEMLKDCLNKKQKYIEDKLMQDDTPVAGSRRSMGDDTGNDNDDLGSVDPDDKESTTEANENTTDALVPTDSTNNVPNLSERAFIPSSITLRPGRLYTELQNAAKASGIAKYPVSRRMLDNNSRVCYACSSSTNPTCWEPDNRTTIKYCRADQNCITKSFGEKDTLTVIRDCAKSCDSSSVTGIEPKYKTCKVCYKDLCNSAAIYGYNLLTIILIITFKCAF